MSSDYLKYLFLLAVLFLIQLVYFKLADKYNIIDKPNERSSHSSVTLRGGGIIFYIGALLYFLSDGFQYPYFFIGLTLIAAISFIDDVKTLSSKVRILIHFAAMLLLFYQWGLFTFPWYYTLLALIVCTGIINAYNFMDGINGITGGYSLILIVAFWYINNYQIGFIDNNLLYFTGVALLVFNFFNFRRKAKCFAGDVGSVSIAFIVLFLLGMLIIQTKDFSYILLLAVYGVDSVLTIIHRLMLKENIFDAHRKHAYQLLANELRFPHVVVSLTYMFLQACVIIGLFIFSEYKWIYVASVIVVLSIGYVVFMKRCFYLHGQR